MINELFIKISCYKTLQRFSLSLRPLEPPSTAFSLQSIKHFYVWKIWKWMKSSKKNFATQFLFYAMLFEWYENIRFRICQPSPCTYVLRVSYEEACCWAGRWKKKSIFNVLYWFSSLLSFTKKKRKMNYFLYIENKINLKMLFLDSTAYAHNTQKNFIIILITFCVSVCGDVYSSWICLMVFQQRSEKRFSMEHNSIMITYVRRRDYSINNSLSQVSGWKALSSRCLPRWSGCQ